MSVLADEALSLQLVMFNLDEKNSNDKVNMSVTVSMACVRVVFLNLFVSSILVSKLSIERIFDCRNDLIGLNF